MILILMRLDLSVINDWMSRRCRYRINDEFWWLRNDARWLGI
jgi:hypothetical protein